MCRLFALKSLNPRSPSEWFFKSEIPLIDFLILPLSEGPHKDGWGVAYTKDNLWRIYKEGANDVEKYNLDFLKSIKSKNILIHLRKASVGLESSKNSHPFKYKNFIFEHNGTVDKESLLQHLPEEKVKQLTSETDSEVLFFLIMDFYEKTKDIKLSIKKALSIARKYPYQSFNFILSDIDNLYAYREISKDFQIDLNYYSLYYIKKENQIIVSSDKLDEEDWEAISPRELLLVDNNFKINKIKI